ncbi:MAG: replication initiation factor domain-containing protein [Bacillota bacterium]
MNEKNEEKKGRKCLYDWVSISSKIHTVDEIMYMLGMEQCKWQKMKGFYGYKQRLYFESVSIHYEGHGNMGVFLEMSGQGCRAFETLGNGNFECLFDLVIANPTNMNITRLDVAYDDKGDKSLPLKKILEDTQNENFVSMWHEYEYLSGSKGTTIYHGSKHSDVRLRIYDKAAERGYDKFDVQWVRCELQLRDDRALNFIKLDMPIGDKFSGVLKNYIRYIVPDRSRKFNCSMTKYWKKILGDIEKISIYSKPGLEYNLMNIHRHIIRSCGGGVKTLLKIYGVDGFVNLVNKYSKITNPKHIKILTDFESFNDFENLLNNDKVMKSFFGYEYYMYKTYIDSIDMLTEEDIKDENATVEEAKELEFERKIVDDLVEIKKLQERSKKREWIYDVHD